jgi:hypothetical protein
MASDDGWMIAGHTVPWYLAPLYGEARQRVLHSPLLSAYLDIVLSDGFADDEDHLRWVIKGRVKDIHSWAKQIKEDSSDG